MNILSLAAQRKEYAPMIGVIERMFESVLTDSNGTPVCAKYKINFLNKEVCPFEPTSKRRINNGIGPISKTFSNLDEVIGFEHPFEWINSESRITPEFIGDNRFDIIGDFDLILRLSETKKIGYIHDTLAVYRLHNSNLSKKRIALHANEMQGWIRENKNNFKNKKNFKYLKLYLIKLKLKILFRFLL